MNQKDRIDEFLELGQLHKDWIDKYVMSSTYGNAPTYYATAVLCFKIIEANKPGNFVECGVAAGPHPMVMHYCMRFAGQYRPIYLFDSFQGIAEATIEDVPTDEHPGEDIRRCIGDTIAQPGEERKSSGKVSIALDEVQARMKRSGANPEHLRYVQGWCEETVPLTDTGPIAILRLDMDLYSPTKVCLEHLYPRVIRGGYVIIDDWRLAGVRRAVDEYFDRTPRVMEIPGGDGPVFWKKVR